MIWIDVALRAAALASAVIATLRAGSRVTYLMDHDGIGIMDGPVIQNTNDTYPLFELSEAFRHCVRLSIAPENYENVRSRQPVATVVEPYPLSPRPHLPQRRQADQEEISIHNLTEEIQNTPELSGFGDFKTTQGSLWRTPYRTILQLFKTIPSTMSGTREYLAVMPQCVLYFTNRVWDWKKKRAEESDLEGDEEGKIWHAFGIVDRQNRSP